MLSRPRDDAAIKKARNPRFVDIVGEPAATRAELMAWQMMESGATAEEAAEAVTDDTGQVVTAQQVRGWNAGYRRKASKNLAEHARQTKLRDGHQIDALLDTWYAKAKDDVNALSAYIRLLERKAKMWGTDAPAKQEITHDIVPPTLTIEGEAPTLEELNQAPQLPEPISDAPDPPAA